MEVDKIVTIINSELKKNNNINVNKIIDKIGLKRKTVKDKLERAGYIFNAEIRQYVIEGKKDVIPTVTASKIEPLEVVEVIEKAPSQNATDLTVPEKYRGLFTKYDVLMKMIEEYEMTGSQNVTRGILTIELPHETKTDTRATFRINDVVYQRFKEFADKHKQFTVKELISQALIEFMEKYK